MKTPAWCQHNKLPASLAREPRCLQVVAASSRQELRPVEEEPVIQRFLAGVCNGEVEAVFLVILVDKAKATPTAPSPPPPLPSNRGQFTIAASGSCCFATPAHRGVSASRRDVRPNSMRRGWRPWPRFHDRGTRLAVVALYCLEAEASLPLDVARRDDGVGGVARLSLAVLARYESTSASATSPIAYRRRPLRLAYSPSLAPSAPPLIELSVRRVA